MTKKQKKNFYRIIITALLFVLTELIPINYPIKRTIFFIIYLFIGYDVLLKVFKNLRSIKNLDENFLMSIATLGAFFIDEFPEAVFVMLFYKTGELFESIAVGKSRKSISSLVNLRPDYANLIKDGEILRVEPESVSVGDIVFVSAGEKIPLDGVVVKGRASLNMMALTGESLPVLKEVGSEVMSGSVNIDGALEIRVEKEFYNSTVSKILELVEEASSNKSKSEAFITKFARYYTPVVVMCAFVLATIFPLFLGNFSMWLKRALIFLVVSCPCALVISVPLSFFAGIGKASKNGILIKGGNHLEALSNVDTVIFDKTGTLTEGDFFVSGIFPKYPKKISKETLLEIAVKSEYFSNHPIALSLKREYGKKIDRNEVTEVTEILGYGVTATVNGRKIITGNDKLLLKNGIEIPKINETGSVLYVSCDKEYIGYIVIEDKIKDEAKKTIASLKKLGIKEIVMLTGDKKEIAEEIANKLGINCFYSELLPQDKVKITEKIMNNKKSGKVCFVGDGINDAPALMRSDIGISMGGVGSDAANEASDVVLMDDKLTKIAAAVKISRKTKKIVFENIIFALSTKFAVLILGVFGYADMWIASFADVGVSVIAILNALRLFV